MSLRYHTFLERSLANALVPKRNTGVLATSTHFERRLRWAADLRVSFNEESWPQGTSTEWDTAPRGEPATGLMQDWLREGALEGLNPPPTQPID